MNKTSIEWCDVSWNPVTGCLHPCRWEYCYNTMKATAVLRRFGACYKNHDGKKVYEKNWISRETGENHIARRGEIYPYGFDPTFYPHRLEQPTKEKNSMKIFVVDTGDLFGAWVPAGWILSIIEIAKACPHHTFLFLTKNPKRYLEFEFPINAWVGTSVTCNNDKGRAEILKQVTAKVRFLSIEPLLGKVSIDFKCIQWIIVGAQTGKKPLRPKTEWIEDILSQANKLGIPVFLKQNLKLYYSHCIQQFPETDQFLLN